MKHIIPYKEFINEEESAKNAHYFLESNKYKSITKCTIESKDGDYYTILSGRTTLKRWKGVICNSFEDAQKLKEILSDNNWYKIRLDDTTIEECKDLMKKILKERKEKNITAV